LPYRSQGTLADDLFPGEEFITDIGSAITDAVGERWRDLVAMRTPVARLPTAYKGDFETWIEDRGGRTPRTMRDSWRRTTVLATEGGHSVEIFSNEPVDEHGFQKVDYVEEDTKPHRIRAKMRAGVPPYQGSLRFPHGPAFMYRVEVLHPGTQGVKMMATAEANIEVLWEEIAAPIVEAKEREHSDRF
jgi:hypothetical protein